MARIADDTKMTATMARSNERIKDALVRYFALMQSIQKSRLYTFLNAARARNSPKACKLGLRLSRYSPFITSIRALSLDLFAVPHTVHPS